MVVKLYCLIFVIQSLKLIIMKTTEITEQDVYQVANDLCMGITDSQVEQVLEQYDDEAENDPTATWDLIVENIIFNLKD